MTYLVPIKNDMEVAYNNSIYTVKYFNNIISTTALDKANTDWDSTTSFAKDSWVRVPGLKRVYRCASAESTDQYPPAHPSVWIDYGATNSYKMFDDIIGSQTEFDTSLTLRLSGSSVNSIAFLNMDGISSISITQTDMNTGLIIYENTISLQEFGVLSLYDYWYRPISYRRDLVLDSLGFSTDAELEITFTSGGIGKIGAVVTGLSDYLGITLYGSKVRLKDYSKYTVDDYGNTSFTKRGYARIITGQVLIDTNLVDETMTKLSALRGGLTLFVADERQDGFASMSTLGYIEEIEIEPTASKTKYPIKIIGVI